LRRSRASSSTTAASSSPHLLEQGEDHRRQAVEVAVEHRPRQGGLGHDDVDGQVAVAAAGEQALGRGEDAPARLRGGDAGLSWRSR
jgi:hypothetical protein